MTRTGKVVSAENGRIKVCFERPEMCAKCGQCSQNQETLIELEGEADAGDMVEVDLPEGDLLRVSLFAYVIPLIALLAGLYLGDLLFHSETGQAVCAVILTALSTGIVIWYDRRLKKQQKHLPRILSIQKM